MLDYRALLRFGQESKNRSGAGSRMHRHGIPYTNARSSNTWTLKPLEAEGLKTPWDIEAPGPTSLEAQLLEDVSRRPTDVEALFHDPANGQKVAAEAKKTSPASLVDKSHGLHRAE